MRHLLAHHFLLFSAVLISPFLNAQESPIEPSSTVMVNALNDVFGAHAKFRANHARGTLLNAAFTPFAAAATISRAPHFSSATTPVLVRFSTFGGIPDVSDGASGAAPYGLSLKFLLPNHRETDLVMHSFNGFPSATAADFVDFLIAMSKSSVSTAHPTPLEQYADMHPAAKTFLAAKKPAPLSFTSQPYFSPNTFKFTNAGEKISYGRYRIVPWGQAQYIRAELQSTVASDYLRTQMAEQLAAGQLRMRLQLQIADHKDVIEDPSISWPESRQVLDLGILTITGEADHAQIRERTEVFMPDELPDGIEVADPMIAARARAYAESLERRRK